MVEDTPPVTLEEPLPPPRGRWRVALGVTAIVASLPLLIWSWVVLSQAVGALVTYQQARGWVPVEVAIEDVRLIEHPTPFGTRHEVVARYAWETNGARHFGHRVGVEAPSDDPFQHERHTTLVEHATRKLPFVALVDPVAPTRSLLFHHPTERLLIAPLQGVSLLLIGSVALGLGLRLLRRRPRPADGKVQ